MPTVQRKRPHSTRRRDFRWLPELLILEDRTTPATLSSLGAAGQFAILDINGGSVAITGSSIAGNIGVGPHTTGAIHTTNVTGAVDVAPTAVLHHPAGGSVSISGGIVSESLAQAQSDANAASAAYAALTPTQSFGNRTASLTITGNGGTNVIAVTSIDFVNKTLTLKGSASDLFVINVARDFTLDHSQIVLTGGVTANHVIFNFTHDSSIDIVNSNSVSGTFLAPHGSVTLVRSAGFDGELIAENLRIRADSGLTAGGFALPPSGASLSGSVYVDMDYSGTRDPGETGVSGITITLTGFDSKGNPVSLTTVTGSDGSFTFTGLAAGTYQLTDQLPSFDFLGTNSVGTVGGKADGTLVGANSIGSIVVTAGSAGAGYNFAVVPPPS